MTEFNLDEIVSIEEIGDHETIDIAVSDDNLFIANDILTHNSAYDQSNPGLETTGESMGLPMTADAQFGIWCTDEDREAGILHVNIMKNRFGPNFGSVAFKIDYDTLYLEEYDMGATAASSDIQLTDDDFKDAMGDLKINS